VISLTMGIALFLGARRLPGWPTPAAWVMRLDTKGPASVPAASNPSPRLGLTG